MRKVIISLIIFVSMTSLYSQNQDIAFPHVTPMSPNAAELAKYADYPVSYYTGTPSVSIPIYEIDVDGFKLPISLNYHASGIRVDQESTWVGLGWSLDVGSRISRSVNGTDDFMIGGWMDPAHTFVTQGYYDAPEQDNIFQTHYFPPFAPNNPSTYNLISDPEPDIFYYNLPGMSGKFLLDKSRGALLFDKSHNLKIQVIRSPGEVRFKITDTEGNQYVYNQWEITKTYSQQGYLNKNIHNNFTVYDNETLEYRNWNRDDGGTSGIQDPYPMVTSWCLTKIITKHGREINFSYAAEIQNLPTQESCENYCRKGSNYLYYYKSKNVNNALRLTKIEGDFGRIEFNSSGRNDIKGTSEKLDAIAMYNDANTLIKCFKFEYSYFNDDYNGNSQYTHVFKRLKLNKLIEYSSPYPSINGYNVPYYATNPLNKGHVFEYFQGSFPAKNSKNVDYWGFQNGKVYGENYYIGVKVNNINFPGVRKDANFDKTIIGTLKKITYPTGGTAEFKYEGHKMTSPYFETHTYEPITGTNTNVSKDLPVFNNYSTSTYDQYPTSEVYSFQINVPTTLKITCSLENTTGLVDTNYSYQNATVNPLGKLRKISPATNNLFTYSCPHIYDANSQYNQGQGSEITLTDKEFTLDAGTYEFTANTPPKNVLAYWKLLYQEIYIPPTPGIPANYTYSLGGIRISEIKTDAKTRRFTYPLGSMIVEPVLYHNIGRIGVPQNLIGDTPITQVSESRTPLSAFNHGNFVGYNWVEEYMVDEEDDSSIVRYTYYNDTESDFFDDNFPDSPRYINYTNGLVKSIEKFTTKYDIKKLLGKEDFSYISTYSNYIKAFKHKGLSLSPEESVITPGPAKIIEYYYRVEWPLKAKVTKTEKTDDGRTKISETNYTYNSRDLLQSTSYSLNNSIVTQKLKYPFEFTSDPVSVAMTTKNMIGMPIETITLKDDIVTQAIKTEYFKNPFQNSDLYHPKTIYKAEFSTPVSESVFNSNSITFYKPFMDLESYSSKGNIVQVKPTNGTSTYYVWGYKEQYPIAKLVNFTSTDAANIQSTITAAIDASNTDTSSALEDVLRATLTTLRNAASNAMVTTYTYDPLIGVTSITDPKGDTVYYQYDSFGRLKQVVNAEGHIVGTNEYNYKQ